MQEEPTETLDPERAGQLAAIGIVKGQPFSPDERIRGILDQAARSAPAWHTSSPTVPGDLQPPLYGTWRTPSSGQR